MELKQALEILAEKNKDAFVHFFQKMCPLPVTVGEPRLNCFAEKVSLEGDYESAGTIKLTGNLTGWVRVHIGREAATKVAKSLLKSGTRVLKDAEIYDCVGEITNMTAGGAKTQAESAGLKFKISTPVIEKGVTAPFVEPVAGTAVGFLPFTVDGHPVTVVVSINQFAA